MTVLIFLNDVLLKIAKFGVVFSLSDWLVEKVEIRGCANLVPLLSCSGMQVGHDTRRRRSVAKAPGV